MRKRLLLLVLLVLLTILILQMSSTDKVFISDIKNIKVLSDKDIKDSKDILVSNTMKSSDKINNINDKYKNITKDALDYCQSDKYTLVEKSNGFNLLLEYDINNTNTIIKYYRERNDSCELLVETKDAKFTDNVVDVYFDNSVVTSIESNQDFEIMGMTRVSKDGLFSYDNLANKYTNPVVSNKGLIMIENMRNLVVFDNNNKIVIKQDNDNNTRRVLAANVNNRSLILLVKNSKQYFLEAYDLDNKDNIQKIKPLLKYEITKNMQDYDVVRDKIRITKNNSFLSFSYSSKSFIVANNFSKLYILEKAGFIMDYVSNNVIINQDELFYIVNLNSDTKENIGKIKIFNYKIVGNNINIGLFNDKDSQEFISYTLR